MNPLKHQLFVDDEVIDRSVRLTRKHHPPTYIHGAVLVPEHPWEGNALCLFGSVLRDRASGRFRMWYLGYRWGSWREPSGVKRLMNLCYAESDDGARWVKPELGLVEWAGSKKNNLVATDFSNPTVIEDPLDPDPARRFKIFEHGVELCGSAECASDQIMRRFLGGNWVTLLEPRRMEIWQGVLLDGEDKREG